MGTINVSIWGTNSTPSYRVGDILDIRGGSLPDRVIILGRADIIPREMDNVSKMNIFMDMMKSDSANQVYATEWVYKVRRESDYKTYWIKQATLRKMVKKHDQPVYRKKMVKEMIKDGYRFVGNYSTLPESSNSPVSECIIIVGRCTVMPNVACVTMRPALDVMGSPVENKMGIWIRYNRSISTDTLKYTINV